MHKISRLTWFHNPCSFVATRENLFTSHKRSKHNIRKLEEEAANPAVKARWSQKIGLTCCQIYTQKNKQNTLKLLCTRCNCVLNCRRTLTLRLSTPGHFQSWYSYFDYEGWAVVLKWSGAKFTTMPQIQDKVRLVSVHWGTGLVFAKYESIF